MPVPLSGQSFCAARSTMPRGSFPVFSSSPWPDLPISCPAYAPAMKSPARYRAGRAKQHNHARNANPFPPSEESEAGSARCLVRPKRPALLGKVPRGFSSIFRLLPGQEGGGLCPLPCPAREVCIAGDSAPGRGHTQQRPLALGCARRLFRPIFLCCSLYHAPGLFPCLFIFSLAGPARRLPSLRTCRNKPGAV